VSALSLTSMFYLAAAVVVFGLPDRSNDALT
jgi:hypothetical protein